MTHVCGHCACLLENDTLWFRRALTGPSAASCVTWDMDYQCFKVTDCRIKLRVMLTSPEWWWRLTIILGRLLLKTWCAKDSHLKSLWCLLYQWIRCFLLEEDLTKCNWCVWEYLQPVKYSSRNTHMYADCFIPSHECSPRSSHHCMSVPTGPAPPHPVCGDVLVCPTSSHLMSAHAYQTKPIEIQLFRTFTWTRI